MIKEWLEVNGGVLCDFICKSIEHRSKENDDIAVDDKSLFEMTGVDGKLRYREVFWPGVLVDGRMMYLVEMTVDYRGNTSESWAECWRLSMAWFIELGYSEQSVGGTVFRCINEMLLPSEAATWCLKLYSDYPLSSGWKQGGISVRYLHGVLASSPK